MDSPYELSVSGGVRKEIEQLNELERLQSENNELRRSLDLFHNMIVVARDCLFAKDAQRRYTYLSPSAVSLIGKPQEQLLGHTSVEIFSREIAEVVDELDSINMSGQTVDTVRTLSIGGRKIILHVQQAPHFAVDGSITGISGAARDITNLLQTMGDLHDSQKLESVGTFAASVAHEFKNFLSIILGHAEMGLSVPAKMANHTRYFREIIQAVYRTRDLVDQILQISRPSRTFREAIPVGELLDYTIDFFRGQIPPTVRLKMIIPEPDAVIVVSRTHFCQIILNLCTNAIHSLHEKPGIITIRQHPKLQDPPALTFEPTGSCTEDVCASGRSIQPAAAIPADREGKMLLSVADTGEGIPPNHLARIFDPFFTTKPAGRGTGLGLAVVVDLMKRQQGSITATSVPGQGTTFTLAFPTLFEPVAPGHTPASDHRKHPSPHLKSLMVVDGEPLFTDLVSVMANKIGWTTTCFNDSREALASFRQAPKAFNMVLTDLVMPGLPGDALMQSIHQVRPEVPVILCSAFSQEPDLPATISSQAARIIRKPLSFEVFADTVNDLSGHTSLEQVGKPSVKPPGSSDRTRRKPL